MENVYLNNLKKSFDSLKWYEILMMTAMLMVAGYAVFYAIVEPSSSHNPLWLTIINFISAVCGIICIFFTAKASISACVFGIINTVVYTIYLAYWQIYGTLCLELFVYLPVSISQWVLWARKRDRVQPELTMAKRLTYGQLSAVGVIVVMLGLAYYYILKDIGGNVPFLDAFTVSLGIVAVTLCMLRYREQYILWLITDIIAVAMFAEMTDPVYFTKKSIYLIMAFVGIYNWYKLSKTRNSENI